MGKKKVNSKTTQRSDAFIDKLFSSRSFVKFIICLIASFSAGLLGLIAAMDAIPNWYAHLEKPVFTPPDWLFGLVWTLLYFLMAIAAFLVWETKTNKSKKQAKQLFIAQLLLNISWPVIFFGREQIGWALFIIIALWISVIVMIGCFEKINKTASWLLMPYLLWVSFALILNAAILRLN